MDFITFLKNLKLKLLKSPFCVPYAVYIILHAESYDALKSTQQTLSLIFQHELDKIDLLCLITLDFFLNKNDNF